VLAGRMAKAFGQPVSFGDGLTHVFPRAEILANADLRSLGLPAAAETIQLLACAVRDGQISFEEILDGDALLKRLAAIPGMRAPALQYVAMCALREPDASVRGSKACACVGAGEFAGIGASFVRLAALADVCGEVLFSRGWGGDVRRRACGGGIETGSICMEPTRRERICCFAAFVRGDVYSAIDLVLSRFVAAFGPACWIYSRQECLCHMEFRGGGGWRRRIRE
jgi:hypothetical protein